MNISCCVPERTPIILSRFYDTLGTWGSLFSFTTIDPEVVERSFDRLTILSNVEGHHNFAYYEAAPRTMSPQREAFFVPVHRTLSTMGAVTGSGVFWVAELKRDPHAPFKLEIGTPFFRVASGTRH